MTTKLAPHTKEKTVATKERTRDATVYSPRVDILETADELLLLADLPGVEPSDLEIRYEDKTLVIHGKAAPRQEDVDFVAREYGVGDFERTFAIGEAVDAVKIAAELKNGVLTVHLPKTEDVKPRRIQVAAG
jgi:HSP20 family protein